MTGRREKSGENAVQPASRWLDGRQGDAGCRARGADQRLVFTLALSALALGACAKASVVGGQGPDAGPDAPTVRLDPLGGSGVDVSIYISGDAGLLTEDVAAPPPLTDFSEDPVLADPGIPANAPTLFEGTPRTSGAPCIVSPVPKTLMPRNWLRPRFEYTRSADENLFEIQLVVSGFAHPLRVYTTQMTYTLDAKLWDSLRTSINDQPITVTVRGLTLSGTGTVQNPPTPRATADFTVAPVDAPGKIVYWAILPATNNGVLRGFGIGEEGVEDVLQGNQVVPPAIDQAKQEVCIGCHSATPDGLSVGFSFGTPYAYRDSMADIVVATLGNKPSFVTDAQMTAVRALRGIPTYSRSHWAKDDYIALLMDGENKGDLLWVNLDTDGQQGAIARTGDSSGAVEPNFSHDGTKIVYVSANSITDGRLGNGPADIYVVPYNNRAGGTAAPLAGAADPTFTEYYPAFSPDDAFVAYTRVSGSDNSYSNQQAEIFVVPASGGTALRFAANDPAACQTSLRSPGVTNDWTKWSPEATTGANGTTYYWVTFSSTRSGRPQLYVSPMTVTGGVVSVDYPALYLWNQPATENNHTPSWDAYKIPPIVIY